MNEIGNLRKKKLSKFMTKFKGKTGKCARKKLQLYGEKTSIF